MQSTTNFDIVGNSIQLKFLENKSVSICGIDAVVPVLLTVNLPLPVTGFNKYSMSVNVFGKHHAFLHDRDLNTTQSLSIHVTRKVLQSQ